MVRIISLIRPWPLFYYFQIHQAHKTYSSSASPWKFEHEHGPLKPLTRDICQNFIFNDVVVFLKFPLARFFTLFNLTVSAGKCGRRAPAAMSEQRVVVEIFLFLSRGLKIFFGWKFEIIWGFWFLRRGNWFFGWGFLTKKAFWGFSVFSGGSFIFYDGENVAWQMMYNIGDESSGGFFLAKTIETAQAPTLIKEAIGDFNEQIHFLKGIKWNKNA